MASRVVLMNALFDQFIAFATELTQMYPADADFALFVTTLKMLRTTNPSLLPKYVIENTSSYEESILQKDESFFLNHSFEEYKNDVDLNIFIKLKDYVRNMSADSKENVWKYIQNIYKLSKAITAQV